MKVKQDSERLMDRDAVDASTSMMPRRMRRNENLRALVSETSLNLNHLVMPIFVKEGSNIKEKVESMPGIYRFSPDSKLDREIEEISSLGIRSVLLFGLPKIKNPQGTESYNKTGVIQEATRRIKQTHPELTVICDVCMCEYTSHGHCGILVENGHVDNDKTIGILAKIALSQVDAGADMVAPSAMMDNQVREIRLGLDSYGFNIIPIMSYSSKFASAFYGPFREAADSAPSVGDRRSYQLASSNLREALREAQLDVDQGADILMVKPALPYLDVVRAVRERFVLPLAAYNVSGEYAMIKAASSNGWLDESSAVRETLLSIKRAGADIIISYFAKQYAKEVMESRRT